MQIDMNEILITLPLVCGFQLKPALNRPIGLFDHNQLDVLAIVVT